MWNVEPSLVSVFIDCNGHGTGLIGGVKLLFCVKAVSFRYFEDGDVICVRLTVKCHNTFVVRFYHVAHVVIAKICHYALNRIAVLVNNVDNVCAGIGFLCSEAGFLSFEVFGFEKALCFCCFCNFLNFLCSAVLTVEVRNFP